MPVSTPEQIDGLQLKPIRNFSDQVNHNIVQSDIEGGVHLDDLPEGAVLEVETRNRVYRIINRGNSEALMSGHPKYCPTPTPVTIHGSTWGGSMLKVSFIGRGMYLEFRGPENRVRRTSRIVDVRQVG